MTNFFRQLRWKLMLSYILTTVGAFLVVILILGGIVYTQIFAPDNILSPEGNVESLQKNYAPLWSEVLAQPQVDTKLIRFALSQTSSKVTTRDFLRIGAVQFSVNTIASFRVLVINADGILLGNSDPGYLPTMEIGQPFDPSRVPGLAEPFRAALAGETDPKRLFTWREPNGMVQMFDRLTMVIPVFGLAAGDPNQVEGVIVVVGDALPTQRDIPMAILETAGRSLVIFLSGIGLVGAVFGAIFAHGLTRRLKRLSVSADAWSEGDFSKYIDDKTGDEISLLSQRLNDMAKQLQSLLRSRQEMAVSEERNRLARDLHDSAKQQALAASFQLGTALTLYERDPQQAKKHLVEADALVDAVRNELTNLVHELRPQAINGQDFSELLKEYAMEWSQRSGIELIMNIEAGEDLSLETRGSLFRIAQEALANIARHSSASSAELSLEVLADTVRLAIKDNGRGFDPGTIQTGFGLRSMRERAEASGGSLSVESQPGAGTQIVAIMPKEK